MLSYCIVSSIFAAYHRNAVSNPGPRANPIPKSNPNPNSNTNPDHDTNPNCMRGSVQRVWCKNRGEPAEVPGTKRAIVVVVVVVVVVVALSWVKAEPLYPHHNYILG